MVWRARAIGDEGHGQRLPSWQSPPRPAGVGGAETGGLCWGELGDAESMHPPAPRGRQPGRPWGRVGGASSPHGGLPRGALGRGVSLEGRGRAWGSSVTGTLWGLLGGTHSCPQAGGSEGLCLPSCPPRPSDPGPGYTGAQGLTGRDPTRALLLLGSAPVPSSAKPVTALSRPLGVPVASWLVSLPPRVASEPLVKRVFGSHGCVQGLLSWGP